MAEKVEKFSKISPSSASNNLPGQQTPKIQKEKMVPHRLILESGSSGSIKLKRKRYHSMQLLSVLNHE